MNDGVALFVTEWGTTPANGLGAPNENSMNTWMDFLEANNISHCNWGVADQTQQGAAQLARGASPSECWSDAQLLRIGPAGEAHHQRLVNAQAPLERTRGRGS